MNKRRHDCNPYTGYYSNNVWMNKHRPSSENISIHKRQAKSKFSPARKKTLQLLTHISSTIRSTQKIPSPTQPSKHDQYGSPKPNNEPPKCRQVRTVKKAPRPAALQGRRSPKRRNPHQRTRRCPSHDGPRRERTLGIAR